MSIPNIYRSLAKDRQQITLLAVYTFLFLFFCSKMSPLYPVNEWADVNVYFNVAKAMFGGMTLYSEVFDHKGPLVFFVYRIGSLFSKDSFVGIFILQLLAWTVSITAIYYTAKLFLKDTSAFILALIAPFSFLGFTHTGGSAEEMILLLTIISTYFFATYFKQEHGEEHKPCYMLVHGVLTAMTFLIKLNLMVFWFFPLVVIFIGLLLNRHYKNFLHNCLAFLAGFALVALPIIIYFVYNGALGEAYHVYIELNKQYSSTNDYSYLISNGFVKLFNAYKTDTIWFLIVTIGIFGYPLQHAKGIAAKISIMLSGISMILVIFFPLTFHFYYPLPLFVFAVLGLIAIFGWLEKSVEIKHSMKLLYSLTTVMLLVSISNKNLFGMGGEALLRKNLPNEPQFMFKNAVLEEKNPTLLNLAFAEGNSLFTTTGITPTQKYFFCPNIYYNMYPDIRDNHAKYIENRETQFVIDCTTGFNYEFFQTFAPLKTNYALIDSCAMNSDKTFYLYKRND